MGSTTPSVVHLLTQTQPWPHQEESCSEGLAWGAPGCVHTLGGVCGILWNMHVSASVWVSLGEYAFVHV